MESVPQHIQALSNPDIYPQPVDGIEMIQTHISWIFLAGDYAYKVKKPVDFGFLDFSTLAKRQHYCERELQLNRATSPQIYLEVVPICEKSGCFAFGSDGDIVDYCLKMRRFSQHDLFDHRLQLGTLDPAWMDRLAADVADFHAHTPSNREIDHATLLGHHIEANLSEASKHLQSGLNSETIATLKGFATEQLADMQKQLELRQRSGHIRHCHGDLHLRNITLLDGRPQLFDCIEFNDDFALIDTMNDIAFLIMDCDAHGRSDLGMRFLSRYLEHSGDYSGLKLLPLYLFYRATVRGKVACLLADELEGNERQTQLDEAAAYFDLALGYTKVKQITLFAVGGLSGSGKSHLSLIGCAREHAIIIRSDATRKRIAPLYPELQLYSREMHILTYRAMFNAATCALGSGLSVILDATFLHPDSRRQLQAIAGEADVHLRFFWLDIAPDTLKRRIEARQYSAKDISDADLRVLKLQLSRYQRPQEPWIEFLTSSNSWPED